MCHPYAYSYTITLNLPLEMKLWTMACLFSLRHFSSSSGIALNLFRLRASFSSLFLFSSSVFASFRGRSRDLYNAFFSRLSSVSRSWISVIRGIMSFIAQRIADPPFIFLCWLRVGNKCCWKTLWRTRSIIIRESPVMQYKKKRVKRCFRSFFGLWPKSSKQVNLKYTWKLPWNFPIDSIQFFVLWVWHKVAIPTKIPDSLSSVVQKAGKSCNFIVFAIGVF